MEREPAASVDDYARRRMHSLRLLRLRTQPTPIAERGRHCGGGHAKSRPIIAWPAASRRSSAEAGRAGRSGPVAMSCGTPERRSGVPIAIVRCRHPFRSADTLNDMDSRASDKIPGARVGFKRHIPTQPSSDARPREWLALPDGAVQEARSEGPALTLVGEPLPYQPGRAERRSGVPAEVITSDHVPNSCTCSWAYSQGKLTLKYYNAACSVHPATIGR
jgi:hypothetical protein